MNTNDRIGQTLLILSDQVEIKESLKMVGISQKLLREDYPEFLSENCSLVRSGSELKDPETDFAYLEILFIVSLVFSDRNSGCSMWNIHILAKY